MLQVLDQSEMFSAASPIYKVPVLLEGTTPREGTFWVVKYCLGNLI